MNNQLLHPPHSVWLNLQYIQLYKANLKGGQEGMHLQQPENLEQVKWHWLWR